MRKLGLGVIGAGGIARRKTIPGILQAKNCTLQAVMDVCDAQAIADQFRVAKAYDTVEALLDDPNVEAVYVASPVYLHRDHVAAAAERKKHILCEKPLARTTTEAENLVAACWANHVCLQDGYMMTFHGAHQRIREVIDAGALGKIVYMRAQLSCWYPPIPNAWRQNRETGGGGALIDMATHLFNLLEFFAGRVRRIGALTGNLVHNYSSEDASTCLLEFASGAHATVDCFFCIPDQSSRTRLEIYGSKGSIFSEGTIGQSVGGMLEGILGIEASDYDAAQNKGSVRAFERIPFHQVNPYTEECVYFADCILNGMPPEINSPAEGLHIMRLTEAAYTSACERRFVEVE